MKDKIIKIIKVIVFLALLLFILKTISNIFVPKTSDAVKTVKSFYTEPKNTMDVVFLGDSAMFSGMNPIVLWDEYKIASYNYATPAERIWTTYYTLQEVLKYQKPKLIVLDTGCIYETKKQGETHLRNNFDNKKDSILKLKAVTDEIYNNDLFDVASYFLPILRYHDRWEELTIKEFKNTKNYHSESKGFSASIKIKANKKGFEYFNRTEEKQEMNPVNKEYLNKIIELCNANNISILFISIPDASSWNYAKHNAFLEFSQNKKIPYIDLNEYAKDIYFDWNKDTSDGGTHLNLYGAEKITKYIGNYISTNYTFENHDNDNRYLSWENDSKLYKEIKEKKIEKINSRKK